MGTENGESNNASSNSNLMEKSGLNTEPSNVWSSLRKIKESETDFTTIFNSKTDKPIEMATVEDIDDMIKDLAQQIADKRTIKKPIEDEKKIKEELSIIAEDNEDNENIETSSMTKENIVINNNTGIQKNLKPFNFEIWKSEMDAMFGQADDPLEKKAADDLYLKNLRQKIQVSVEKVNKENKNKEKAKVKKVEQNDINNSSKKSNVDDFAILKLKEKERKKKKTDAKFQQKVVDNTDKMKEMSIKTKKIEKISLESEEEIQKIRDMAKKLIAKSEAKENEFNEIFLNLDNLENVTIESEKKKGKKGRKKVENNQKPIAENEVHWTEVENNKWDSQDKGVSKVTNVLAALKAAAENGQSSFVTESLKTTISNCKKMEQEDEEERKMEKIRQDEEEKQRKKEIVKLKNQEKEEQIKEKMKREANLKIQAEKKIAEEKAKIEIIEKEQRMEKEKEKRRVEKENKEKEEIIQNEEERKMEK